jgi:general L-amino acid transport system permease protein
MGLWLRKNLFNTWYNVILTLAGLFLCLWGGLSFLDWAITQAKWAVVTENLGLFVVGRYPEESIWRIWLILTIIAALSLFSWQLNRVASPIVPLFSDAGGD